MTKRFFDKVDVDRSGDLSPGLSSLSLKNIGEGVLQARSLISDMRCGDLLRTEVSTHSLTVLLNLFPFAVMQAELEEQNRREMAEIEQRLRQQAEVCYWAETFCCGIRFSSQRDRRRRSEVGNA